MLLGHVEGHHVTRFVDAPLPREPPQGVYAAALLRDAEHVFAWCVRESLLEGSPMAKLRPPKVHQERRFLEVEEYEALVASIEADAASREELLERGEIIWVARLVHLLVGTGLRIGELRRSAGATYVSPHGPTSSWAGAR